jgi:hypothetical protein
VAREVSQQEGPAASTTFFFLSIELASPPVRVMYQEGCCQCTAGTQPGGQFGQEGPAASTVTTVLVHQKEGCQQGRQLLGLQG